MKNADRVLNRMSDGRWDTEKGKCGNQEGLFLEKESSVVGGQLKTYIYPPSIWLSMFPSLSVLA